MSCDEISADWAAQRIKGLDLWSAMSNALRNSLPRARRPKKGGQSIKTLIESLPVSAQGPRHDVGRGGAQDAASAAARSRWAASSRACAGTTDARRLDHRRHRRPTASGETFTARARHLLGADPRAGGEHPRRRRPARLRAARAALPRLPHRRADRRQARPLPRQLDLHPRAQREGRPHPELPLLVAGDGAGRRSSPASGLEYFCFEGDGLWNAPDAELIALAKKELAQIGLVEPRATSSTAASCASRRPIRSTTTSYSDNVETIRARARRALPDAAPGRPQRHAQVQQPGPRHDDGDADRREHPGRRDASTTSGTSTRTPSTTRPARPVRSRRSTACAWCRAGIAAARADDGPHRRESARPTRMRARLASAIACRPVCAR